VRTALVAAAACVFAVWHRLVYTLPKVEYNRVHPFTSWIPITAFIVLRNVTPGARTWPAGLFGWLGCITLETYISQYHTWLLSKVPDGQPVYLLVLLPGLPLLNFAACSALYVFVSHRLFRLTGELREALVPHDDDRRLARNAAHGAAAAVAALAAGALARALH
jgi:N-acetylneuraminate 9-O-acetyltransferase